MFKLFLQGYLGIRRLRHPVGIEYVKSGKAAEACYLGSGPLIKGRVIRF